MLILNDSTRLYPRAGIMRPTTRNNPHRPQGAVVSSRYARIFDNDGVPFWDGPREAKIKCRDDIVLDYDGLPRYMGTPDQVLDWYYEVGIHLKDGPFRVLVQRIELDRYLDLDEYFEYFEYPTSLSMFLISQ